MERAIGSVSMCIFYIVERLIYPVVFSDSGRRTVCTTTTNALSGVEITSLVHVCSMIIKALGVATDFMSGGHILWVRMIPTVKTPSRMWTCVLESTQEFVAPAASIRFPTIKDAGLVIQIQIFLIKG